MASPTLTRRAHHSPLSAHDDTLCVTVDEETEPRHAGQDLTQCGSHSQRIESLGGEAVGVPRKGVVLRPLETSRRWGLGCLPREPGLRGPQSTPHSDRE